MLCTLRNKCLLWVEARCAGTIPAHRGQQPEPRAVAAKAGAACGCCNMPTHPPAGWLARWPRTAPAHRGGREGEGLAAARAGPAAPVALGHLCQARCEHSQAQARGGGWWDGWLLVGGRVSGWVAGRWTGGKRLWALTEDHAGHKQAIPPNQKQGRAPPRQRQLRLATPPTHPP